MTLNKQNGNMYQFITHTWNTIGGKCHHGCSYCYNNGKPFFIGDLRLKENSFMDDLKKDKSIFVGSSNDLFQESVPREWILKTFEHCNKFPENTYLFQTKNPRRYGEFIGSFPLNSLLGTTLESNRRYKEMGNAPPVEERVKHMGWDNTFVTIEPIMDFDLEPFVAMIRQISPVFVAIGGSSGRSASLTEPPKEKIDALIAELKKFTEVRIKKNLARLV